MCLLGCVLREGDGDEDNHGEGHETAEHGAVEAHGALQPHSVQNPLRGTDPFSDRFLSRASRIRFK